MQITSPSYSFVKFGAVEPVNNCCDGDQEFCIPVIEEDDTYFQAIITSDNYAEITAMMDAQDRIFHLLLLAGSDNTEDNFSDNVLRDWTGTNELVFEKYRTGLFEITIQWRSNLANIKELLDCGDCFQLAIVRAIGSEFSGEFTDEFTGEFSVDGNGVDIDFVAISNCFKRSCLDCFTTVLEYYNDDDYAEFNYCILTNPVNRVRLPFYLLQPKITEDKAVYRKSNGIIKQTKSLLTKEYQVLTEHFPEQIHDKLTIALAHDNVNVISGPYTGGISKNGEYAIEWSDNDCKAPASFKALATPYAIRNNNCQDCSEIELCTPPTLPEFTLPAGEVGQAYTHTENVTGSLAFTLTPINTPGWMTISLVGNLLSFTGTPTEEITDGAISFSVANACGTVTGEKIIDVTLPPCVGVSISGSPSLPNGIIGVAYTYNFSVSGTAPYSLTSIVKPSWMTIAVAGSSIVFSGTPDTEGTGITVSFEIDNCTSDSVDFTDTIDVAALPHLTEISNSTGPGTYIQTAQVGSHVATGNRYVVTVYSHDVTYTSIFGDTPASVAIGIRNAINATSEGSWNSASSAPAHGTTGFPPSATSSSDTVTITLDAPHSFTFNAYAS